MSFSFTNALIEELETFRNKKKLFTVIETTTWFDIALINSKTNRKSSEECSKLLVRKNSRQARENDWSKQLDYNALIKFSCLIVDECNANLIDFNRTYLSIPCLQLIDNLNAYFCILDDDHIQ